MSDDIELTLPSDDQNDRLPGSDPQSLERIPTSIDRFRIQRVLGKGGFGTVYLAFDEQLERQVAVKVPNSALLKRSKDLQLYLKEARTVARLEHPNIVPVFEVGGNGDYPIYIVSKFIEGMDLAAHIKRRPPSNQQAASWINDLSQALRMAHSVGIVHRDIKPQNILVDLQNRVFLVDFGLALRDDEVGKRLPMGGTPAYMSPEQAKGEGHRVDGRSDIFSLGVVLYELLARHRPFHGDSSLELFEQIIELDPKPLRQWNDAIDRELERICQKMLSKRKSQRYSNAADLSEDLTQFVSTSRTDSPATSGRSETQRISTSGLISPNLLHARDTVPISHTSGSTTLNIVPKGLRSFDDADADFFLELLPGPRDREGLPETIGFWKTRIAERDAERTLSVGLIYGSSGCGKSSMMKAGLLPRLSPDVVAVYLEATPEDTERSLLNSLQKRLQAEGDFDASEASNLTSLLASVRRGSQLPVDKKLLIVIDQFEQWLYVHPQAAGQELLNALMQCDGSRVQAIVMVRDDFWMAATRFFQDLDILLLEHTNSAAVDLFDLEHAARVLKAFGRAFGKLAPKDSDEVHDRKLFITEAVKGLSENNQVISVRLSLFAEMMKSRPWTLKSLQEVGGTAGIGATFLEETFSAAGAPPEHRYLQAAARAVLRSLLPEAGTDIKGHMRSRDELFSISGCQSRPRDFDNLLRILDSELRLITPVDRQASSTPSNAAGAARDLESRGVYFQLTHDYLVASLRDWLTRKQRETKRGRAELKLAERAASWNANRENKQLPSLLEWLSISSLTNRKQWTTPQRTMMHKAGQTYALRGGIACLLIIMLSWGGIRLKLQLEQHQAQLLAQKDLQQKEAEAEKLVEGLLTADATQLPSRIAKLMEYREWAEDDLTKIWGEAAENSTEKLYAGLALISHEAEVAPGLVEHIAARLLDATPHQFLPVRTILAPHKSLVVTNYWTIALDPDQDPDHRLHAASALADFDMTNTHWNELELVQFLADRLVAVNPIHLAVWEEALKPVSQSLLDPLSRIFNHPSRSELARSIATSLIADYAKDNAQFLSKILIDADASAFTTLLPVLQSHGQAAIRELEEVLGYKIHPDCRDSPLNAAWGEPAISALDAVEKAHGLIAERFAFCQNMPLEEFKPVAESLRASGYRPTRVRAFRAVADTATKAANLGDQLMVAAIWTRDGRRWLLETYVNKSDLPGISESASKDGLTIVDLSIAPGDQAAMNPACIVLWSEPNSTTEQRRIVVGVGQAELNESISVLAKQGFQSQNTLHAIATSDGERLYSGVWTNQTRFSEMEIAYAGNERIHRPQWDIAVAPYALRLDPLAAFKLRLERLNGLPVTEQQLPENLAGRAECNYQLGNLEAALQDIIALATTKDLPDDLLAYKAVILARLSKPADAQETLDVFLKKVTDESYRAYVKILVSAGLAEWQQAAEMIEVAARQFEHNPADTLDVARAAALCSAACRDKDAHRASDFAKQSIQYLRAAIQFGFADDEQMRNDPDWIALHTDPQFVEVLEKINRQGPVAALWRTDLEYESRLLSTDAGMHAKLPKRPQFLPLDGIQSLVADGFRPFAIAVGGNSLESATEFGDLTSFMLLHRPRMPDNLKEELALRQVNAAVALLRMNAPHKVWPMFKHEPDPRVRSYLIHRLTGLKADAAMIARQLNVESDTSCRRALILAVGEFANAQLLDGELEMTVKQDLARLYTDDPDPGIHAACEWALRQLGDAAVFAEIRHSQTSGEPLGTKGWYVTRQGEHTMMILKPASEFLMGSPLSEEERYGGPDNDGEALHRRVIDRTFAIASHEVTIAQFMAFRQSHDFNRVYSRESDAPANLVSWYDAAAYCNWLSQKENIPPDQWCYDPAQDFADGMRLDPDLLQRTGYRLPTEDEWEYACRAGALSSRYFGETESLLGEYAWYSKNSDSKGNRPVGSFKPNDFGLFDMQGNIFEWCQNETTDYRNAQDNLTSHSDSQRLDDRVRRILRGGSFFNPASYVRSAYRNNQHPNVHNGNNGFRPARTLR